MAAADPATTSLFCPEYERFKKPYHVATLPSAPNTAIKNVDISVDIETTGQRMTGSPSHPAHAMVEFGAAAFDADAPGAAVPFSVYEGFMGVPQERTWDTGTRDWFTRDGPGASVVAQMDAMESTHIAATMEAFATWVADLASNSATSVTFFSDNPAFDVAWINMYMQAHTTQSDATLQLLSGVWSAVVDTDSFRSGIQTAAPDAMKGGDIYAPFEGFTVHRASHDAVEIYRHHAWTKARAREHASRASARVALAGEC